MTQKKEEQHTEEQPKGAPTFIDLFAGCGGLSLGLLSAGWSLVFAVERNEDAFRTYSHNLLSDERSGSCKWPDWLPRKAMTVELMMNEHGRELESIRGTVDLVAGGPPCQGFSMAGMRRASDPRNRLSTTFLSVVDIVKPRLVLVENVEGITMPFLNAETKPKRKPKATSEKLTRMLQKIGYEGKWITLQASRYGVAQNRSRSFLIAVNKAINHEQVIGIFEEYIEDSRVRFLQSLGLNLKRPVSVRTAISDLQALQGKGGQPKPRVSCPDSPRFEQIEYGGPENKYQRLLRAGTEDDLHAPNSMRLVKHRKRTTKRFQQLLETQEKGKDLSHYLMRRYKIVKHCLAILSPDKPAPTVTSIPDDFIHYYEPRVLTVRELARVQSFPDWFEFQGKYTTGGKRRRVEAPRYTQVANAVPPFLAQVIGMALKTLCEKLSTANG